MLRKATGMAGIVVFSGPFEGFNEGFQFALESLALSFMNLLHLPTMPRWAVYVHATPSEQLSLVAAKDGQVMSQTGRNLPLLVRDVLQASCLAWPRWAHRQATKAQSMAAAWIVPDAQIFSFECVCEPHWGPRDVAAECRLEASARIHLPSAELALAYHVHRLSNGALRVKVDVCQQSLMAEHKERLKNLGLQLQVFTTLSQVTGMSSFLGLSLPVQQALHERIGLQVLTLLAQGELTC